MYRTNQAKRRLLALLVGVTMLCAAGVSANLFLWGGVPVNVHVSDDELGPGEETKVTFNFQQQSFSAGEVHIIYSDNSQSKTLWQKALLNPPLTVWNNEEPFQFTLETKDSFTFTEQFEIKIWLRIDAVEYSNVKAEIDIRQPPK